MRPQAGEKKIGFARWIIFRIRIKRASLSLIQAWRWYNKNWITLTASSQYLHSVFCGWQSNATTFRVGNDINAKNISNFLLRDQMIKIFRFFLFIYWEEVFFLCFWAELGFLQDETSQSHLTPDRKNETRRNVNVRSPNSWLSKIFREKKSRFLSMKDLLSASCVWQ